MSVVIVGGHDRMVCQYMKICKNYKCKQTRNYLSHLLFHTYSYHFSYNFHHCNI